MSDNEKKTKVVSFYTAYANFWFWLYIVGKISIEHITIFLSKYISKDVVPASDFVRANWYLVQSQLMAYKKVFHYQGVTQETSYDG